MGSSRLTERRPRAADRQVISSRGCGPILAPAFYGRLMNRTLLALDLYRKSHIQHTIDMVAHWQNRQRQIIEVALLSLCYHYYHTTQLNRVCADSTMSFEEAEHAALAFGRIFDEDIPVDAFLPNADKQIDDSIESYKHYKDLRETLTELGYEAEDVDAFCKMVYHSPDKCGMWSYRSYCSIQFSQMMVAVWDYLEGQLDYPGLVAKIVKYDFSKKMAAPLTKREVRFFVRQMIKSSQLFHSIIWKRRARRARKDSEV